MLLSDLIVADVVVPAAAGAIDITGLTADSRAVRPGFLFAALAGSRTDGARFVADAVAKGAAAILAADGVTIDAPAHVPVAARTRAAPGARAHGGAVSSAPAGAHARHHRHQRQDVGR